MTDAEINAAALSDPDNPPLTPEREARLTRVPQVRVMRRAMGLTQEDFSARCGTGSKARQNRTRPRALI